MTAVSARRPLDARRLRIFVSLAGLYVAQGVPGYLIVAAVPPVLREYGVSRTTIGMLSFLMVPLVLKFLWAPLVDRFELLPIGHWRGWILPTQLLSVAAIALLAFLDPLAIWPIFVVGAAVSLLTSTQDIATDAYATSALAPDDRPVGNAIQGGAVAFSVIIGGTLGLVLFERIGWRDTILVIAAFSALPLLVLPLMAGDDRPRDAARPKPRFRAFFARREAVAVLVIALVYRASEGLVKAMEGSYLVDAGLPLSWIGYLSGLSAATAGLIGSVVAAVLVRRTGLSGTLLFLGGLRTLCFLLFGLHALGWVTGVEAVIGAAALQTMIRYMEIVALYSLFMAVSSSDQPGTDFTILACAQLIVYLLGSSISGVLADRLGYAALFLISALLSGVAVAITVGLLRRWRALQPA
ncbi:MFS transporter [Prosthecomicrobium pneumaticum]|uniref:PAT family beta-lactamase induction signal transducer AmpG n=1 Tax=Prosthecomicrobium pneumaticum TaxID=81895 RepID=A0A7W9CUB3_9HYPH|nr:MFS transporter [Prosthecomicrobium pneumaticum]MBB5751756.1 PAT family beta-lactamase induction signal transducer AmpG [Prosthecomicrobium pneumaticum]